MSTVSAKEKNMLMVIVVLVLYAVAALCYKKQKVAWERGAKSFANARKKYERECALIDASSEWDEKYKTMCSLMPVFPHEKDVATHWLNTMDTVASEKALVISRRQIGKEEEVGDVFELPVECKNWEGTLESLVGFLYGLHKEGAMLDVRQLFVKPSSKPGYLKGTFSLYCAYMRGDVVEENPEADGQSPGDSISVSVPPMKPGHDKQEPGVRSPVSVPQAELRRGKQEPGTTSKEVAVEKAVTPVVPAKRSEPASMDVPAVPGPESAVPVKDVAVPLPRAQEKDLRTEEKGADAKTARAKMEEDAVKAALKTLEKKAE